MGMCACCNGHTTFRLCALPDNKGAEKDLYLCGTCAAITPGQGEMTQDNTDLQVRFHDAYWSDSSRDELRQAGLSMLHTVNFYKDVLGRPDGRIVCEIGAGRGNLTWALKDKGYRVVSCEPSQRLVDLAHKHYALDGELSCETADSLLTRLEAAGKPVQAVFLWHVIEHLENPIDLIRRCAEIIAPAGAIIVQAPMPASPYIYPEHRFFINRAWAHKVGELCGLTTFFCDASPLDQFLSLAWCQPKADLRLPGFPPPAPPIDPLSGWLEDLTSGLVRFQETYHSQKDLIDKRDAWIEELRNEIIALKTNNT